MRLKKKAYTRIFTLGVLGFLILIPSLASASFTFPNFSSTAGLTLNGNANMSGTALRLTPALVGQHGSAWFNHQQAIDDFDTTFQFQITGSGGLGGGADGITFVVHNSAVGTAALGGVGENLGYFGAGISIENSIVVEFDTFTNESLDDVNANHIGVYNLTGTSDVPSVGNRLGRADAPANTISDGGIHTARIQYSQGAPGTLDVYLDGILELSVAVDLPASVGGSPAYVGFTSATGGGFGNHDIFNWSFQGIATNPDNRHAYEAVAAPNVDWDGVNAAAAALSFQGCPGHLATITSQAENDFIKNNLPAAVNGLYWLGAYQPGEPAANLPAILAPGASWVWVTGEPFVYTNWAGSEPNDQDNDGGGAVFGPNEDALHFWVPSGKWNDRPRSWPTHLGYVVEYECAAPTGSVDPSEVDITLNTTDSVDIDKTVTLDEMQAENVEIEFDGSDCTAPIATSFDPNTETISAGGLTADFVENITTTAAGIAVYTCDDEVFIDGHPLMQYTVTQGGNTFPVKALQGTTDIVSFYDYGGNGDASADTDLEDNEKSILFLYRDNNGNLSLVMIHDWGVNGGGTAGNGGVTSFTISGLPNIAAWAVRDDNPGNDGYPDQTPPNFTANWQWNGNNTDGGAIQGGLGVLLGLGHCITIDPTFISGINTWHFLSGPDDANPDENALTSLTDDVVICGKPVVEHKTITVIDVEKEYYHTNGCFEKVATVGKDDCKSRDGSLGDALAGNTLLAKLKGNGDIINVAPGQWYARVKVNIGNLDLDSLWVHDDFTDCTETTGLSKLNPEIGGGGGNAVLVQDVGGVITQLASSVVDGVGPISGGVITIDISDVNPTNLTADDAEAHLVDPDPGVYYFYVKFRPGPELSKGADDPTAKTCTNSASVSVTENPEDQGASAEATLEVDER